MSNTGKRGSKGPFGHGLESLGVYRASDCVAQMTLEEYRANEKRIGQSLLRMRTVTFGIDLGKDGKGPVRIMANAPNVRWLRTSASHLAELLAPVVTRPDAATAPRANFKRSFGTRKPRAAPFHVEHPTIEALMAKRSGAK